MTVADYAGIAGLVTSTCGGIAAIIVAVRQPKIGQKVDEVHAAVSMSNGHTMGEVVESTARAVGAPDAPPLT